MLRSGEALVVPASYLKVRDLPPQNARIFLFKASSRPCIAAHNSQEVLEGRRRPEVRRNSTFFCVLYLRVARRASFSPIQAEIGNQVQRCPTSPQAPRIHAATPTVTTHKVRTLMVVAADPKRAVRPSSNGQRRGRGRPDDGHLTGTPDRLLLLPVA